MLLIQYPVKSSPLMIQSIKMNFICIDLKLKFVCRVFKLCVARAFCKGAYAPFLQKKI